ncbi:ferredoxin [Streptomyces chartreusis]|uniref:ferredoxin n=1 Tax=Streptomyces chartreusis TaxID=1969 RepID=UPI0036C9209B
MVDISVDRGKCCGSGLCVMVAPEVFDQAEDDGLVFLRLNVVPESMETIVCQAIGACPTSAISLTGGDREKT